MYLDRVQDTTQSTGTGNLTLDNTPPQGFRSPASYGSAHDFFYCVVDPTTGDWEVGLGGFDPGTGVLTRNTGNYAILSSSNAGAAVSFAAGAKDVLSVYPAAAIGEARVTVSASAPTSAEDESYGYLPDQSLWVHISGSTITLYKYDGSGTWTASSLAAYATRSDGSGATGLAPAGVVSTAIDLTGVGRFGQYTYRSVLAGRYGRTHVANSFVVGHDVYGSESGRGFHQSEIQGTAVETTDASPLTITGIKLQEDGTGIFELHVVAHENAGDYKVWKSTVVLTRVGTAAYTIVTGGTPTVVAESAGATTWTLTLASPYSGASAGLQTACTGEAGKTIHWTVSAYLTCSHNSAYT